jgi:hypothetical protein
MNEYPDIAGVVSHLRELVGSELETCDCLVCRLLRVQERISINAREELARAEAERQAEYVKREELKDSL